MNIKSLIFTLFITSFCFSAYSSMNLQDYLEQIKQQNDHYKSSELSVKISQEKASGEASFLTKPYTFAELMRLRDEAPRDNPTLALVKTMKSDSLKFGLEQQTEIGLSGKIGYAYTHSMISPSVYPSSMGVYNNNYSGSPFIELRFPLLKNFLGQETLAKKQAIQNNNQAAGNKQSFENKVLLAQAEGIFWQLVISRDLIKIQQEALSRYQKIKDWNAQKVKKGLADKADLLQAEAAYNYKSYEVKNSIHEEGALARKFNSLRGRENDQVREELASVREEDLNFEIPKNTPLDLEKRDDLKAARALYEAKLAEIELSKQKITTQVDFISSYSLNSKEIGAGKAASRSFNKDHPVWALGISVSAPLGGDEKERLLDAYNIDKKASQMSLERKQFELKKDWYDLQLALKDARERLHLAKIMEEGQLRKLSYERERLYVGRSTTYQVLQAEIDYTNAQQIKLKEEGKILGLLSEIKLYL